MSEYQYATEDHYGDLPPPNRPRPSLFQVGRFTLHSGAVTNWRINCEALGVEDYETLAYLVSKQWRFKWVTGIPRGGLELAKALQPYCRPDAEAHLLVDDVLTTGASMEEWRKRLGVQVPVMGSVIFARGPCPGWILPLFRCYG